MYSRFYVDGMLILVRVRLDKGRATILLLLILSSSLCAKDRG